MLRAAIALLIGAVAGGACARFVVEAHPTDFAYWWQATRLWVAGFDPYVVRLNNPTWPLPGGPLYYPLPALIIFLPFSQFSLPVAAALFFGVSSAWLAWRISRDGLWRLLVFVTPSFYMATKLGQWSALLTAAMLVPTAGFILTAKPTLGLACFLFRPTWRALVSGAAIGVVSLAIWPSWPAEWLVNLRQIVSHPAPVATPLGLVMLLGLLRWRQPEARLLVAMACVPQVLFFADQLPLGLVARTRAEAMILSLCGMLAFTAWWFAYVLPHRPHSFSGAMPYALAGCYLPALLVVLHRPNEGPVPPWVERVLGRVRARLDRLPAS